MRDWVPCYSSLDLHTVVVRLKQKLYLKGYPRIALTEMQMVPVDHDHWQVKHLSFREVWSIQRIEYD